MPAALLDAIRRRATFPAYDRKMAGTAGPTLRTGACRAGSLREGNSTQHSGLHVAALAQQLDDGSVEVGVAGDDAGQERVGVLVEA